MDLESKIKLKKELSILYNLYKFSMDELLQYKALNYSEIDLSKEEIHEAITKKIDPIYALAVGDKFDRLYRVLLQSKKI